MFHKALDLGGGTGAFIVEFVLTCPIQTSIPEM